MKLIKPYYTILNEGDLRTATRQIERAARTCYKSEDKISAGSDIALVTKLRDIGHEAMLEFGPSITVLFVCDRGVSHEIVRHRLCSFAQESTRYCNYSKDKFDSQITFIIPCWLDGVTEGIYTQESTFGDKAYESWFNTLLVTERCYNDLINKGWQPQQARSILPNSLKTEINVKANLREWRHIFQQRAVNKKAHPQMRELMLPLLRDFQALCPVLFDDIKEI